MSLSKAKFSYPMSRSSRRRRKKQRSSRRRKVPKLQFLIDDDCWSCRLTDLVLYSPGLDVEVRDVEIALVYEVSVAGCSLIRASGVVPVVENELHTLSTDWRVVEISFEIFPFPRLLSHTAAMRSIVAVFDPSVEETASQVSSNAPFVGRWLRGDVFEMDGDGSRLHACLVSDYWFRLHSHTSSRLLGYGKCTFICY